MPELSLAEVAERYAVRTGTVRAWCARGLVPDAHKGDDGVWRIPAESLDTFTPPARRPWSRRLPTVEAVEAERDLWRRKAEAAIRTLQRITEASGQFDDPHAVGWRRAAHIARACLDRIERMEAHHAMLQSDPPGDGAGPRD